MAYFVSVLAGNLGGLVAGPPSLQSASGTPKPNRLDSRNGSGTPNAVVRIIG